MSASGSGSYGSETGLPVGQTVLIDEASALIAWREAVQGARSVLLQASRLFERGSEGGSDDCSDPRLGAVLAGLRDLEVEIDGHLASPPGGDGRPAMIL